MNRAATAFGQQPCWQLIDSTLLHAVATSVESALLDNVWELRVQEI